jgi:salicylate biosynthesis isochorismate synthase
MYNESGLEHNSTVLLSSTIPVQLQRLTVGALNRLEVPGLPLQLAWFNPQQSVWAIGFGIAAENQCDRAIDWPEGVCAPCGPWFGGWAFDNTRLWEGFPAERWVLPKVLVWKSAQGVFAAAFGEPDSAGRVLLSSISERQFSTEPPRIASVKSDEPSWNRTCAQALAEIEGGRLKKLVLARTLQVVAHNAFDARRILRRLEAHNHQSVTFLYTGTDGSHFVGATPETLCRSDGRYFYSQALAGTAKRVEPEALHSKKNIAEHQAVVDAVTATLGRHSRSVSVPSAPEVLTIGNLLHLSTSISAQLNADAIAIDVAKNLHPTPAVAGTPRSEAVNFLRGAEPFARGWYGGVVGHRSAQAIDLRVGLRAAHVQCESAALFVGAGLVQGSTVESEWAETEAKARVMLDALEVQ